MDSFLETHGSALITGLVAVIVTALNAAKGWVDARSSKQARREALADEESTVYTQWLTVVQRLLAGWDDLYRHPTATSTAMQIGQVHRLEDEELDHRAELVVRGAESIQDPLRSAFSAIDRYGELLHDPGTDLDDLDAADGTLAEAMRALTASFRSRLRTLRGI